MNGAWGKSDREAQRTFTTGLECYGLHKGPMEAKGTHLGKCQWVSETSARVDVAGGSSPTLV